MKKLLVAAALAASFAGAVPSAQACTLETCWFSKPVCEQVKCEVCWHQPGGGGRCLS